MVKTASTEETHEVVRESRSRDTSRTKNRMALKKYRLHKKITIENLQKKADILAVRCRLLMEERDRLKSESDALTLQLETHAKWCSGILNTLLEYTAKN